MSLYGVALVMPGFPELSRVIMWVDGFGSLTIALVSTECPVASRGGGGSSWEFTLSRLV